MPIKEPSKQAANYTEHRSEKPGDNSEPSSKNSDNYTKNSTCNSQPYGKSEDY